MGGIRSRALSPVILFLALLILAVLPHSGCRGQKTETVMAPPPTVAPPEVNPWKEAAGKVEEDRDEAVGRQAKVNTPAELKHYSDRRRFLAIQVAEAREQGYELPHDYAELIELIRAQNLIELEPLGKDYILYGVGANASDEPFTHYDSASGENIPLLNGPEELKKEQDRLSELISEPREKIAQLEAELKKLTRRDRSKRVSLQGQIENARKSIKEVEKKKSLLGSFYKNEANRKLMDKEYRLLAELAADFGGKSYDLNDADSRRQLKVRLLSFIRPEARDVLQEIARAYKDKFDRPLPITSLIRPEQYQRRLGLTNPNATKSQSPPHSTGLAFDVFYYYMSAAEQDFLMSVIARIETEGRIEALRENRNHFHLYAFPDGRPPSEELIAKAAGQSIQPKNAADKGSEKSKADKASVAKSSKRSSSKSTVAKGKQKKKAAPVAQRRNQKRGRGSHN